MIIRKYSDNDCETISKLFYETVRYVNSKHYSAKQLSVWAVNENQLSMRREELSKQNTLIAEINGKTVGFGSIDKTGYLDLLFVHKDWQRKGIATALCDELEHGFSSVTTYASITAKPFFEKRGYKVIKEQEVERLGTKLTNYIMIKN